MLSSKTKSFAIAAGIAALLLSQAWGDTGAEMTTEVAVPVTRVFYYGSSGDGYLGRYHSASWSGETPAGWPEVVDLTHYGIATSDWSIPFGTELCIEIVSFSDWAEGAYDERIGTIACGVVVDRMAWWVERHYGPSVDLWPALFQRLAGDDWERIGTFTAKVWMRSSSRRNHWRHSR